MSGKRKDFLEIDFKSMSDEKLAEAIETLNGIEAHIEALRAGRAELIERVRSRQNLSTEEIVKCIAGNRRREDRDLLAKEWSKALARA